MSNDNNTEQERAVVEAIRFATGDDCMLADGEAAVAVKALARAGYVLVERALVEAATSLVEQLVSYERDASNYEDAEISNGFASLLRRAAAAGNGEG